MVDVFVMFAIVVTGCGGFVVLYLGWIYILAKVSRVSFKEAMKWWED